MVKKLLLFATSLLFCLGASFIFDEVSVFSLCACPSTCASASASASEYNINNPIYDISKVDSDSELDEDEDELDMSFVGKLKVIDVEFTEVEVQSKSIVKKTSKEKTPVKRGHFELSIDSEFTEKKTLSVQGVFKSTNPEDLLLPFPVRLVVLNKEFETRISAEVKSFEESEVIPNLGVYYDPFDDKYNNIMIHYLLTELDRNGLLDKIPQYLDVDLYMYYSTKDLTNCFGAGNMFPYYYKKKGKSKSKKTLVQNRNTKGELFFDRVYKGKEYHFKFIIRDLYGLGTPKGGLAELASSVGLEKSKALDQYKSSMDQALLLYPGEFIEYAMNDAEILPQIFERKIQSYNDILNVFYINELKYLFTKKTTPTTMGSTVNRIWSKYFYNVVFKADDVLFLSFLKQGVLNEMHHNYIDNVEMYNKLCDIKCLADFYDYKESNPDEFNKMTRLLEGYNVFRFIPMNYASVNCLISESKGVKLAYSGLTTGGRTVNERPYEQTADYGADIDIQGAYGTILSKVLYPIGRPRVYSLSPNESEGLTLGQFMRKYEHKKQSGLYKISVSGKLSFNQDFIMSKIPPQNLADYKIVGDKEDPDDLAIDSDFILLRREIINGFITQANWEVIKKVATNNELKDFRALKVESAVFWLDEDRVNTIEELSDVFLKDRKKYTFSEEFNAALDSRTYKWYGIPFDKFIGPLMEERMSIKKEKDPLKKPIEQAIKLVINTMWGDITSPYFQMNNVVVSEIVTSNIRTNVWMISKALNTRQSITDGGIYTLMDLSFLQRDKNGFRRPGFATLSSYYIYKDCPYIKYCPYIKFGPLGGINWKDYIDKNTPYTEYPFTELDKLPFWPLLAVRIRRRQSFCASRR